MVELLRRIQKVDPLAEDAELHRGIPLVHAALLVSEVHCVEVLGLFGCLGLLEIADKRALIRVVADSAQNRVLRQLLCRVVATVLLLC